MAPLHEGTYFGGEVRLELWVRDLQVLQQLLGECLDVGFVDESVHQL